MRITEKGREAWNELQKYPESERPRILHEMLHEECRDRVVCPYTSPCPYIPDILESYIIE